MILSRRKTHLYASVALAATLPIIFFAGLLLRSSAPVVDRSPDESLDELFALAQFPTEASTLENAETLSDGGIELRAIASEINGQSVLKVKPVEKIQAADILVYWQSGDYPADTSASASFPEDATSTSSTDTSENTSEQVAEDAVVIDDTAILLGRLAGDRPRQFSLPADVQGRSGQLMLYSQGQNSVLATFPFAL